MSVQPAGGTRASLERVIDALVQGGFKHRVRGDHVQAECCTHPDSNPSVSIDWRGGVVGIRCQGGCPTDGVVEGYGLRMADLWDEPKKPERDSGSSWRRRADSKAKKPSSKPGRLPKRVAARPKPEPVDQWEITQTYDYHWDDGSLAEQTVRRERTVVDPKSGELLREKAFYQRYADGDGGWLDKAPAGFLAPLLNQAAVRAACEAGQEWVWLDEGEKDAQNVEAASGQLATTNPSGASNLTAEQAAVFAGGRVRAIVDNDLAGYRRAAKVLEMVGPVAAELEIYAPAVDVKGADATDHLDEGNGLEQLVRLSEADIASRIALWTILDFVRKAEADAAEVDARVDLAAKKDTDVHMQAAARWAIQLGRHLRDAHRQLAKVDDVDRARAATAVETIRAQAEHAYEIADEEPDDLAAKVLRTLPASDDLAGADDDHGHRGGGGGGGATRAAFQKPIPMSRGLWCYELDEPRRGVYTYLDGGWERVAQFPYVRARIARRDGSGRRNGTDYLLSASPDGPGVLVGHIALSDGSWANELGMPMSRDRKIIDATATAISYHAMSLTEREAVPRVGEDGRVAIPVPDTLPAGYLQQAPVERDEAMRRWQTVIELCALSPRLGLVLGASAAAPFVQALYPMQRSHLVSMYGDARQGKTTAMRVAGAIWGDSVTPAGGVVESWNQSAISLIRDLGTRGCLPAFADEAGQADISGPAEWGRVIYDICEGAQRKTAKQRSADGVQRTRPWHGILFSTGNGRLTEGLGAGKYAGVGARVIDLETPLTTSAAHAEKIEELLVQLPAYGHAGTALLERFSAADVAGLIAKAEQAIGLPEEGNARTVAKHLQLHLAGAAMLDQIADTGTTLYTAALEAACDYMDAYAAPVHDADRLIELIRDAMAREPAMWPTESEYKQHREPFTPTGSDTDDIWGGHSNRPAALPVHGVNRSLSGVQADDGSCVWVFAEPWHEMCDASGVDETIALRELHKRDILLVTESRRRKGEWKTQKRFGDHSTGVYKLALPELEDDTTPTGRDSTPTGKAHDVERGQSVADAGSDVGGAPDPCWGSVGGDVGGVNNALTCNVGGVGGVGGETSRTSVRVGPSETENAAPTAERPSAATGADPAAADPTRPDLPGLRGGPRPPCIICGEPALSTHLGQPCHLAECADDADQLPDLTDPAEVPEPSAIQPAEQAEPDNGSAELVAVRNLAAAVADVDGLHLPDGQILPLPADLVSFDQLLDLAYTAGVGWRSKSVREGPQVWCTRALSAQVGALVEDLPELSEETDRALAEHGKNLAWLKPASDGGWSLTSASLGAWMNVKHPVRGRGRLVHLPYCTGYMELRMTGDDPDAATLARRLQAYAQLLGMPYRISPATTGIDLMHALRPRPREQRSSNRVTSVQRPVAMPPMMDDDEWRIQVDSETYFCRKPLASEAKSKYLHWYDRNGQYLSSTSRVYVGSDVDPVHHPDGTSIDPRRPGWIRVAAVEWEHRILPNPWVSGIKADKTFDERWMPTTFAEWLQELGYQLEVREAWIWEQSVAYLDPWYTTLRKAREAIEANRHENVDADMIQGDFKLTYSAGLGKLASRTLRDSTVEHLQAMYRPDWYSLVRGKSRANVQRVVRDTHEFSHGRSPVAVREDAVAYVSDDPDPMTAWPGDRNKVWDKDNPDQPNRRLGGLKPYKSALLADVIDLLPKQPPARTTDEILKRCTPADEWRVS